MSDDEKSFDNVPCPCCGLPTLHAAAANEICPECGWEDDGQGDDDADVVRGGPNGALSLTAARENYAAALSSWPDRSRSVTEGGPGLWWSAAMEHAAASGMPLPDFDLDDSGDEAV